jgi:hypothetical protein
VYQNNINQHRFVLKIGRNIVAPLCLFAMTSTPANTLPNNALLGSKSPTFLAYTEKTLDHRNCYNACSLNPDPATREMCFDSCRKANANKNIQNKTKPNN